MACDAKVMTVVYASKAAPNDASCGCYHYGHPGPDGKPCHHFAECAAHKLIRLMEEQKALKDLAAGQ